MFWKWPVWQKLQALSDFIVWHLFFLTFATVVADHFLSLVIPDSNMFRFYATLYAFEPAAIIWYISNVLQVLFNILILVPFALFIYDKRLPCPNLWAWILIGKIFFDISGNYYQFLDHKSIFSLKVSYGIVAVLLHAFIWIPSYIASFSLIIQRHSRTGFRP